mgnify:FL=1
MTGAIIRITGAELKAQDPKMIYRIYIAVGRVIMPKLFTPRTAVYAIASLLLALQLVLAVQKYLSKPSMTSPATRPFTRKEGLANLILISEYLF